MKQPDSSWDLKYYVGLCCLFIGAKVKVLGTLFAYEQTDIFQRTFKLQAAL